MNTKTFTTFIITVLLLVSCGGGGGNQQATASATETAVVETIEIAPIIPAIIDIAGNLENRKEFRLSDFGSSVQYIRLQPPEGIELGGIRDILSNDEFLFVSARNGLFIYSADGEYLHTLVSNEWEESGMPAPGGGVGFMQVDGILNNVDFLNGTLFYRTRQWSDTGATTGVQLNLFDVENLSENPHLQPTFQRELATDRDLGIGSRHLLIDNESVFTANSITISPFFTALSIKNGDTLFTINNYHQPTITAGAIPSVHSRFYRINGNLMLQIAHNDTVFALVPPNRVEPAFIMEWGEFRSDMNRRANGQNQDGKFLLQHWVETQHHIFIEYTMTESVGTSAWDRETVTHHYWAVFDKEAKTLTHHIAPPLPTTMEMPNAPRPMPIPLMFENDIDLVGMPFFPRGVNHRGEMFMVFGKRQVQQQIATGKFDNSRLQALYNRMEEGSFYLMVVR